MYVAPPVRMGAWPMACVLRQRIEYYILTPKNDLDSLLRMFRIYRSALPSGVPLSPHACVRTYTVYTHALKTSYIAVASSWAGLGTKLNIL